MVMASAFLTTSKKDLERFFDTHQLGIRSKFDVEVKILQTLTNVKTARETEREREREREREGE